MYSMHVILVYSNIMPETEDIARQGSGVLHIRFRRRPADRGRLQVHHSGSTRPRRAKSLGFRSQNLIESLSIER
ncbi:hypothetical protein WN51_02405 [Melipona quadrifasciata]|uniref:Uncharacterized protein n=1 Tax=Melipona quadrifasciata TaxID=166423 RepID=A0A0N0BE86_9HYME|nr:hypothetical protein WN51_02405 [Melipona quadrifasciata]